MNYNKLVVISLILSAVSITLRAADSEKQPNDEQTSTIIHIKAAAIPVEEWDLRVSVGQEFSVGNLAASGSTGYHWNELIDYNAGPRPIEFVRTVVDRSGKAPAHGMVGTPPLPQETFYRATKEGVYTLRFMHSNPGVLRDIARLRIIHLEVVPEEGTKPSAAEKKNYKEYTVNLPATPIEKIEHHVASTIGDEVVINGLSPEEGTCWYFLATIGADQWFKFLRKIAHCDIAMEQPSWIEWVFEVKQVNLLTLFIKTKAGAVPLPILSCAIF